MSFFSNLFPPIRPRVAAATVASPSPVRLLVSTAPVLLTVTVALLTSGAANPSPPFDSVGSVVGHAAIVTLPVDGEAGTNIMLLLDESRERREPDGWVDHIFTLRTNAHVGYGNNVRLDDVIVDWSKARKTVTVRRNSESIMSLTLQNDNDMPTTVVPSVRYGYDIGHHGGLGLRLPSVDRGRLTAAERVALTDVLTNAILGGDCDGGGPGAESCSVNCKFGHDDCSVTCQDGYYACCDHSFWYGTSCGCEEQTPTIM